MHIFRLISKAVAIMEGKSDPTMKLRASDPRSVSLHEVLQVGLNRDVHMILFHRNHQNIYSTLLKINK